MARPRRGKYGVVLQLKEENFLGTYMHRSDPYRLREIRTWPPNNGTRTKFCVLYEKGGEGNWQPSKWGNEAQDYHQEAGITGDMRLVGFSQLYLFRDKRQTWKVEGNVLPTGVTPDAAMGFFLRSASTFILTELQGMYESQVQMQDIEWGFIVPSSSRDTTEQEMCNIAREAGMAGDGFPPLHFITHAETAAGYFLHMSKFEVAARDKILFLGPVGSVTTAEVVEIGGAAAPKEISRSSVELDIDAEVDDRLIRLLVEKGAPIQPGSVTEDQKRELWNFKRSCLWSEGNSIIEVPPLDTTKGTGGGSPTKIELSEGDVLAILYPVYKFLDLVGEQLSGTPCKAIVVLKNFSQLGYLMDRLKKRFGSAVKSLQILEHLNYREGGLRVILQAGGVTGGEGEPASSSSTSRNGIGLFTEEDIKSATNNFSPSNKIGTGRGGHVYKGSVLGLDLAVKQIRFDEADEDFKNIVDDIEREMKVLYSLQHPHVLYMISFEISFENREICLVTEYASAGSLQDYITGREGARYVLTWSDRVRISREIAAAVLFIHEQGIVHRDLKPANVLVDEQKKSKICDMGLAWDRSSEHANRTRDYSDPQIEDPSDAGPPSDVYALGLIVLQLFTGIESCDDAHTLLSLYEKLQPATSVVDTAKAIDSESGGSSSDRESQPSKSRWAEDKNAFNKLIGRFSRLHLDGRSAIMPRDILEKAVRCVLRCVEGTWDLRPTVEELMSALEELEGVAKLGDDAVPFWTTSDSQPHLNWQGALQLAEQEREVEKAIQALEEKQSKVEGELEELLRFQAETNSSKEKLKEVRTKISSALDSENYVDITSLSNQMSTLSQSLTKRKRSSLGDLNDDVTKAKGKAAGIKENMLQKKQERAIVRLGRLRMERVAARRAELAAEGRCDVEEAAKLRDEVLTVDEKMSSLRQEHFPFPWSLGHGFF